MGDLEKCKNAVRAIAFAIFLLLIAFIVLAVGAHEYSLCDSTNQECIDLASKKLIAGMYMIFAAWIIIIIASLNAAYRGCYSVAISGTILSTIIF